MADPTNKAELLEAMDKGYRSFEALLAPLSEEQLTTPGVNGDWSVKDILVHLATWQGRVAQRLEGLQHSEEYQPILPKIETDEEMNRFNDETFAANRNRPLAEVLHDFRSTYRRVYAGVEQLKEEMFFDASYFPWMNGQALWEGVDGNTFGHYAEHGPMIEKWLAK